MSECVQVHADVLVYMCVCAFAIIGCKVTHQARAAPHSAAAIFVACMKTQCLKVCLKALVIVEHSMKKQRNFFQTSEHLAFTASCCLRSYAMNERTGYASVLAPFSVLVVRQCAHKAGIPITALQSSSQNQLCVRSGSSNTLLHTPL